MNVVFVIAHKPLASALQAAALHVLPDADATLMALDIEPDVTPEQSHAIATAMLQRTAAAHGVLLLTDTPGATPCNVASRLLTRPQSTLLAGVNLPMLLRALHYREQPLADLTQRALEGGVQGVRQIEPATTTANPP